MTFRLSLLIITTSLLSNSIAQSVDVLHQIEKPFYTEENKIRSFDSSIWISHSSLYDEPNTFDEEFKMTLSIIFKDPSSPILLKSINVSNDTSIVKCYFTAIGAWNSQKRNVVFTGTIKVISISKNTIEALLDIRVSEIDRNWTYIYKGQRKFTKS